MTGVREKTPCIPCNSTSDSRRNEENYAGLGKLKEVFFFLPRLQLEPLAAVVTRGVGRRKLFSAGSHPPKKFPRR